MMLLVLLLLGCSGKEQGPMPTGFTGTARSFAEQVVEALDRCDQRVATPLRNNPEDPEITADRVRTNCGSSLEGLDRFHRDVLAGKDRSVDQLLAGTARVLEDVRILVHELGKEERDPMTHKGGVDHLVDSVPAILPIAARIAESPPSPWTTEATLIRDPAERQAAVSRVLERLERDLVGLADGFEGLAWTNRSAPVYVRHRMLRHSGDAARARLSEATTELRAIDPEMDISQCERAAQRYLARFNEALAATRGPVRPEDAWTADRDALRAARDTWKAACTPEALRGSQEAGEGR